ncbi:hypothetical protein ACQSSU_30900 [Micromonospora echinospora]
MVVDGRDTVVLPAVPEVFALYRTAEDPPPAGGVLGWIVVLPDGRVLMVRGRPESREIVWCESLATVETFWSPMSGGDVVRVTGPTNAEPALHHSPGVGTRPLFPDAAAG